MAFYNCLFFFFFFFKKQLFSLGCELQLSVGIRLIALSVIMNYCDKLQFLIAKNKLHEAVSYSKNKSVIKQSGGLG